MQGSRLKIHPRVCQQGGGAVLHHHARGAVPEVHQNHESELELKCKSQPWWQGRRAEQKEAAVAGERGCCGRRPRRGADSACDGAGNEHGEGRCSLSPSPAVTAAQGQLLTSPGRSSSSQGERQEQGLVSCAQRSGTRMWEPREGVGAEWGSAPSSAPPRAARGAGTRSLRSWG